MHWRKGGGIRIGSDMGLVSWRGQNDQVSRFRESFGNSGANIPGSKDGVGSYLGGIVEAKIYYVRNKMLNSGAM